MAFGADSAPTAGDTALFVDEESAAFDAANFLAVHIFFDHHVEERAELLVGVGDQGNLQPVLLAKIIVLAVAIARDAEQSNIVRGEGCAQIAEFFIFYGATRGVVARVKIQNPKLPQELFGVDFGAVMGAEAELRYWACRYAIGHI